MGPRAIIVTGCDERQFPLALGLMQSMSRAGVHNRHAIGFIDAGISDAQRRILPRGRIAIAKCDWDFDFPTRADLAEGAPGLRTLVGKLRMRELFPGYDIYVWLDADTWIQDGAAIEVVIAAAAERGLAAAYEIDRGYVQGRLDWVMWSKYQRWYAIAFPGEVGRYMDLKPMLNVGVYGLAADAPHWFLWDWLYRAALGRQTDISTGAVFMADQLSLNVAVHYHRLPIAVLPATFNWLCHLARPTWDPASRRLCEPSPPYEPLRIVHLSGSAKSRPLRAAGLDGIPYIAPPRYPLRMRPATPAELEPVAEEVEA